MKTARNYDSLHQRFMQDFDLHPSSAVRFWKVVFQYQPGQIIQSVITYTGLDGTIQQSDYPDHIITQLYELRWGEWEQMPLN